MVSTSKTVFEAFRKQYPQGSLVSDLVTIQDGQYVVRAAVLNKEATLATGMAANADIQIAEDTARERAIALLGLPTVQANASHSKASAAKASTDKASTKALTKTTSFTDSTDKAPKLSVVQSPPASESAPNPTPSVESTSVAAPKTDSVAIDEAEEDLGPPIDAIAESSEPVDESLAAEGSEPAVGSAKVSAATIAMENFDASANPVDLSDVIAQTDVELTRLGWTSVQGREYLEKTYGKRSRQQLTDEELLSFLLYLEDQ